MHDGLFAGESSDQIFTGSLPGFLRRNVNGGQAWPEMPAPVQIVEADHRQIARKRQSAALCFQQHAICDDIIAAHHRRRPLIKAHQIARRLAGIVQSVGHFDVPFRWHLDTGVG